MSTLALIVASLLPARAGTPGVWQKIANPAPVVGVVGVAVLLLAASVVVASQMGAEFVPRLDEGSLAIQIVIMANASIRVGANTPITSSRCSQPKCETVGSPATTNRLPEPTSASWKSRCSPSGVAAVTTLSP